MIFEIETKPYETEKVYKRRSFELNPGITILVGCNGAGKSTMLRYIFSKLKKENIPYEFYDNLSDGGNQAMSAAGFYGDMDLLVNLATMSEGESIVMNYTQFAVKIGRMTNYFGDKSNWGDQVRFVINELKRNPSSRRAVIDVRNNNEDMYSNDPACLQHIQYFVRDGKLECKVLFRSNDACKAAFMNMFALIMLQKKIADALGLPVGSYTHRANSFHCYERDFDLLKGYVDRIATGDVDDLCYDYEGDWDELMEEAKESIAKKVESLRG